MKEIFVERETYTKNNKEFFSYFVKGVVRGKEVKVMVMPPDVGGYQVLDIVFGESNKAPLTIVPYELKTESGEILKGNSYAVTSTDKNGEVYECKIKPSKQSDKSLLAMIVK